MRGDIPGGVKPVVPVKPLRSFLYVPGNREPWLAGASRFGADALIFDLEDSVPLNQKAQARRLVQKTLDALGKLGHTIFVRVNALETELTAEDLEAVVSPGLYGIVLPKAHGPEDIAEVDALLTLYERRVGLEAGTVFISPSLETARAVREAYEIGKVSRRVAYMSPGSAKSGDLSRALGYTWTREGKETLFLRSKVLLDARAAGDPFPRAGVWSEIEDFEGLRAYALEMRHLGYTGLTVIHPRHVPTVNEVFTPSRDEIAYWQGLIQAMEEAEKAGRAAVPYQGHMVDIAMVKTGRAVLKMAQQLGLVEG